jgi:hypothetical protein
LRVYHVTRADRLGKLKKRGIKGGISRPSTSRGSPIYVTTSLNDAIFAAEDLARERDYKRVAILSFDVKSWNSLCKDPEDKGEEQTLYYLRKSHIPFSSIKIERVLDVVKNSFESTVKTSVGSPFTIGCEIHTLIRRWPSPSKLPTEEVHPYYTVGLTPPRSSYHKI